MAPFANVLLDPTAAPFDLTLIDSTAVIGADITLKKIRGVANNVTLKPQAGQTIEGASEYVLSGLLGAAIRLFSDGTSDWKISSKYTPDLNLGSFHMHENITVTTIGAIDTNTDIAGTATASSLNSNFTFSTAPNALTYTGIKDITAMLTITASMSKANSSDKVYRILGIKNGVEIEGCNISTNILKPMIEVSVSYPVELSTDDVIKVMMRNETDTEDVDVTDLVVTMNEI
jgi:hypothetical protein